MTRLLTQAEEIGVFTLFADKVGSSNPSFSARDEKARIYVVYHVNTGFFRVFVAEKTANMRKKLHICGKIRKKITRKITRNG